MRKATRTGLALAMVLALAGSAAAAGTGRYEWRVSFSNSDANVQTAANPAGVGTLYLWFTGCNTVGSGPGMSAADFGIHTYGAWTFLAFSVSNGYLNAGSGANLLLAVGGCEAGPIVAGSMLIQTTGEGGVRLGDSNTPDAHVTVDCESPIPNQWAWPDFMLFVGAQSSGFVGRSPQAWGDGCTTDAVDRTTWGNIKSLYR